MKNLTVKRFLLICIVFAMGVLSIVGVAADVVRVAPPGAMPAWMCYVGNGFDVLRFDSGRLWKGYIVNRELILTMGFFIILQLTMALVTVIIAVTMLFRKNEKKNRRLGIAFMIVCLSLQFIYMVLSIIASALYGINHDDLVVTTLAYIPFIFGLLLFIAFLVLCKNKRIPEGKYLFSKGGAAQEAEQTGIWNMQNDYSGSSRSVEQPSYGGPVAQQGQYVAGQPVQQPYYGAPVPPQQAAGQSAQQLHYGAPVPPQQAAGQSAQQLHYGAPVPPQQPAPQPSAAESMEEKVKLLTQYKQLLDSGILTQEEFDKLKAETLGTN